MSQIDGQNWYNLVSHMIQRLDKQKCIPDCQLAFLAKHHSIKDQINNDFRRMDIVASFIQFDRSIKLIASNDENYQKAIKYLATIIVSKKLIAKDKNLYLQRDLKLVEEEITFGIKVSINVDIVINIDDSYQSCTINLTGRGCDVSYAVVLLHYRLKRYYSHSITTAIIVNELKMEYIQLYLKESIQKVEYLYHCSTSIQFNQPFRRLSDNDISSDKVQVDIRCPKCYQLVVMEQLHGYFNNIKVEENWIISKYSNLGRYLQSHDRRKALIQALQKQFKCIVYVREYSYTIPRMQLGKGELLKRPSKSTLPTLANYSYSTAIKVNEISIEFVQGAIETMQADVIVNSIGLGNYCKGTIAKSLWNAGGQAYKDDCNANLANLTIDDIGITDGRYFKCQKIYHIPFLSSCKTLPWLISKITQCIELANDQLMTSIAIPALGTGGVGMNVAAVAKGMIDAAMNFAMTNPIRTQVKFIYFTVLKDDISSSAAFNLARFNVKSKLALINNVTRSKSVEIQPEQHQPISLYSARYDLKNQKSCAINVYYGNIQNSETDGILDLTEICQNHLDSDGITLELNSAAYSPSQSLLIEQHEVKILGRDPILIKCCPHGMITHFGKVLKSVNKAKINSIAIPLLGSEGTKHDISLLFDKIFEFVAHCGKIARNLQRIDFVINHWHRCLEITTWIRHQIAEFQLESHLPGRWTVIQDFPHKPLGIDIAIIAADDKTIEYVKTAMKELMPSFVCQTLTGLQNLSNLDENDWFNLKMDLWNQHNTILTKNSAEEYPCFTIYGSSEDVINAAIELNRHAQQYYSEKANHDLLEFTSKAAPWQVKIGHSYYSFDEKLNYEIEKCYQLYQQGKATLQNVSLDAGTKTVNYKDMIISLTSHHNFPIKKTPPDCFTIPEYWQYDTTDGIQSGMMCRKRVTEIIELTEINDLIKNSGITLTSVERVQNWNLYQRYQLMKMKVTQTVGKFRPGTIVEKRLFHGTKIEYTDSICREGFNRDYSRKSHGAVFGIGTYFSASAIVAQTYGHVMIIARVLTGISGNPAKVNEPNLCLIPGSNGVKAHSVNISDKSIFVIFHDNAAYPEYILHYVHS